MSHQPFIVGFDVNSVSPNQTFDWINNGANACKVHVSKPNILTAQDYNVPPKQMGGKLSATVCSNVKPGTTCDYTYDCGFVHPHGNPQIIIGS